MKKLVLTLLIYFLSLSNFAHATDNDKLLNCAGVFTSTQFIKQGDLPDGDLAYKEISLSAAKFIRTYLLDQNIAESKINSGINSKVDELYGKAYNDTILNECYEYVYNSIAGSKEKIEEISRTIYGG